MGNSFRNAMFQLCKEISSMPESLMVRNAIQDLLEITRKEGNEAEVFERSPYNDLAYIAANQRLQFLGFLLADESVETINNTPPFQTKRLEKETRSLIESAHKIITTFINMCLGELMKSYPKTAAIINPYCLIRPPQLSRAGKSLLKDLNLRSCVEAFQKSKVYQQVKDNKLQLIIESVDMNILQQLAAVQKKQFSEDRVSLTRETQDYLHRMQSNTDITQADILLMYFTYCYALGQSLRLAIQMLYDAILGKELTVLDNDSVINILGPHNNGVFEEYKITDQTVLVGKDCGDVGSIALIDCDCSHDYHVKEFGIITAMTLSMNRELGNTSKFTIVTVDEDLNEIHHMTNTLMNTVIGQAPVVMDTK